MQWKLKTDLIMDKDKLKQLSQEKGTVLVEIYASWCPHCRKMMPVVDDVKALLAGKAAVYQFDIDENQAFADELGVETIPTFIVFKDGKEVWRTSGEIDGQTLYNNVARNI